MQVLPVNEMVRMPPGAQIEILFDELVDPVSIPGSVTFLPPIGFTTRIRGRRIIIRPDQPLRENQAYVLTLRRGIRDYQRNPLEAPQQLVFSTGETIPTGRIKGRVWGTQPQDGVWIGLFDLAAEQDTLFQALALSADGSFDFRYLPDGRYRMVAVAGGVADFPSGMGLRSYAMPALDWIDIASDTTELVMQLSPALAQPQIQSAEWVTDEYMLIGFDVPFDPASIPDGLLPTANRGVYGYLPQISESDTVTIALGIGTGRLSEQYSILPATLLAAAIVDTLPPIYSGGRQLLLTPLSSAPDEFPLAASGRLLFSEPVIFADDFSLQLMGTDTVSLPVEIISPLEITFTVLAPEQIDKVALLGDHIHDHSGNALADSLLTLSLVYNLPQAAGQIRGSLAGVNGNVVIEARSEETGELVSWVATDSSSYLLEEVPPGEYFIFAHVQVGKHPLPYYSGRWMPFSPAAKFAQYPGIIEVRPRWEVDGVDINFNVVTDNSLIPEAEKTSQ